MAKHSLPPLSLVCLKTANIVSAKDLVKGRNTVIGEFQQQSQQRMCCDAWTHVVL